MSTLVYVGIGAGGVDHPLRGAVEQAIASFGHRISSPLANPGLLSASSEELAKHFAECTAVLVPLSFPFDGTEGRSREYADFLRREYDAVKLLRRGQQDSTNLNVGHRAAHQNVVVFRPVSRAHDGADPRGVDTGAVDQVDNLPEVQHVVWEIVQEALKGVARNDTFDSPNALAISALAQLVHTSDQHPMVKVMLSSTSRDLSAEYAQLETVLSRLGGYHRRTRYEKLRFTDIEEREDAEPASRRYVQDCDFFIGIVRRSGGTIMKSRDSRGDTTNAQRTYTQLEFELARELHRPRGYLLASTTTLAKVYDRPPTGEERERATTLRNLAESDHGARRVDYDPSIKDSVTYGFLDLLDWLGKPGRDRVASLPPSTGNVYVAHEYTLIGDRAVPIRTAFGATLDSWWRGEDSPRILEIRALGGMGKSAATWSWFRGLTSPEESSSASEEPAVERPSHAIWWSFYAPDSTFGAFVNYATRFLHARVGNYLKQQPPPETAGIESRAEYFLRLLRAVPGKTLIALDGLERALVFYRQPGFDARLIEGPAIDEALQELSKSTAARIECSVDDARRALLSLSDNTETETRLAQLAGRDDGPFAKFLTALTSLPRTRVLVTTRFTPTVLEDLASVDKPQVRAEAMPGLTEAEARALWEGEGLTWEDSVLPTELGGDLLREVLCNTSHGLGGYALPIALLSGLVRRRCGDKGTLSAWKATLDPITRTDRLGEGDVNRCILWVIHQVLNEIDTRSLEFQVLSFVMEQANATDYPALRRKFVRAARGTQSPTNSSTPASATAVELDHALERLRQSRLLGRDHDGYRYELHPLVRRAVQSFDSNARTSVVAFVAETERWIAKVEPPKDQGVELTNVEKLWGRVALLVTSGAPLAATSVFLTLDKWIRYYTTGPVLARRNEYLHRLEHALQNSAAMIRAARLVRESAGPLEREVSIERALRQVRARLADGLMLDERVDEAAKLAKAQGDEPLAQLVLAHAHLARLEPEIGVPLFYSLVDRRDVNILRWSLCALAVEYARLGQCAEAHEFVGFLDRIKLFSHPDADIELARLQVKELCTTETLTRELDVLESACGTRLAYGRHWAVATRARLSLDGRLGPEAGVSAVELTKGRDEAESAGYQDVAQHLRLACWRRARLDGGQADTLAREALRLVDAGRRAGNSAFFCEATAHVVPALLDAGLSDQARDLALEALTRCRTEQFAYVKLAAALLQQLRDPRMNVSMEHIASARRADLSAKVAQWSDRHSEVVERSLALVREGSREFHTATQHAISDTRGWSEEQVRQRLGGVKASLDWESTTGSARSWWEAFEKENASRLALVLRLAEQLAARKTTITSFFLAYVYSNTDNIEANLHYHDYSQLKRARAKQVQERELRLRAGGAPEPKLPPFGAPPTIPITDTSTLSLEQVQRFFEVKRAELDWKNTTGSALKWWKGLENEYRAEPAVLLRLAEELSRRGATATEFFLAYVYANTEDLSAIVSYLDYSILKKRYEDKRRRESASKEKPGAGPQG